MSEPQAMPALYPAQAVPDPESVDELCGYLINATAADHPSDVFDAGFNLALLVKENGPARPTP